MKIRLVADCSANICENLTYEAAYAPLTICTSEKEYKDTLDLDVPAMLQDFKGYKGTSSTACPSTIDWMEAFGEDSDVVLGVSLTSGISGCYNAAVIAAKEYMKEHKGSKVFILDSLSTGPELEVLLEKYQDYLNEGLEFEEITEKIQEYLKHSHLCFALESVDNFARNGRVSPLVAKAVGILGLRIVGRASEEGTLEPLHKVKGEKRGVATLYQTMKDEGYKGGRVSISHSYNEKAAELLKNTILEEYPNADLHITINRGLCCYYAEMGGLLVGFEDL